MPGYWPRNATCGREALTSSIKTDAKGSKQDALQNSQEQYRAKGDRCGVKVHPAHAPHVEQCPEIQQTCDPAVITTAANTGLRQVLQETGQEEQAQREGNRGEDKRQRRAGAGLVVDRRLREAARHRIAVTRVR